MQKKPHDNLATNYRPGKNYGGLEVRDMSDKKSKKPLVIAICAIATLVIAGITFLLPIDYVECGKSKGCEKPPYPVKCGLTGCVTSYTTIWRKMTGAERIYDRPFWKK